MSTATREISFVHAISAAGVMFTLTKNCSLGELANCGCDVSRNGKPGKMPSSSFHNTTLRCTTPAPTHTQGLVEQGCPLPCFHYSPSSPHCLQGAHSQLFEETLRQTNKHMDLI